MILEILDLRSRFERRLDTSRPDRISTWPARMLGHLVGTVTARRLASRPAPPRDVLVVSVGNLRVGGTGKTPVVQGLAAELARRGIAGAVLTRGYKAVARGPLIVQPANVEAGDEARLLAAALQGTGWVVVQSPRRSAGLDLLLEQGAALPRRPQVIVLEDAYQTTDVGRHLDVLILDCWAEEAGRIAPRAGAVLPFGPYREPASAAFRADVWLLETALPGRWRSVAASVGLAGFTREMTLAGPAPDGEAGEEENWGLLSGLARPAGFEQGSARLLPTLPRLAVRFPDHCRYTPAALAPALAAGRRLGITHWLTTEKDAIKLHEIWPADLPLQAAGLSMRWHGEQALPDLVEERLMALGAGPK